MKPESFFRWFVAVLVACVLAIVAVRATACENPEVVYKAPEFPELRVPQAELTERTKEANVVGLTSADLRFVVSRNRETNCPVKVVVDLVGPVVRIADGLKGRCYAAIQAHEHVHVEDFLRITQQVADWIADGVEPKRAFEEWSIKVSVASGKIDNKVEYNRLYRICNGD